MRFRDRLPPIDEAANDAREKAARAVADSLRLILAAARNKGRHLDHAPTWPAHRWFGSDPTRKPQDDRAQGARSRTLSWRARPRDRRFFSPMAPIAGLVREVADRLVARFAGSPPDPLAHTSINAADHGSRAGPAGRRGTRPIPVRRASIPCACVAPPRLWHRCSHPFWRTCPTPLVVLEAGNLTRDDTLRKLAEKAKNARALPCYADNDRALAGLIETTFRQGRNRRQPGSGQRLAQPARQ